MTLSYQTFGATEAISNCISKNVFTGEWVDIAVVRDTGGYINFYIDGKLIAKSSETVLAMAAPKTAHSIGADGSGGQIFAGRIADVRVWDDVRTADEIKNNRTEKVTGVRTNGFNKNNWRTIKPRSQ